MKSLAIGETMVKSVAYPPITGRMKLMKSGIHQAGLEWQLWQMIIRPCPQFSREQFLEQNFPSFPEIPWAMGLPFNHPKREVSGGPPIVANPIPLQ